jgi:predicted DCC family thiol-disulfide oxidoreductase YuxK
MNRLQGRDTMLFDGDCGICTKSAQWAEALDKDNALQIKAYFEFSEEELAAYGLDYAQCSDYLRVVAADGAVYSGAAAINYCALKLLPSSLPAALLQFMPFILPFEALVYHFVAKNRTQISIRLGLNACKVERR